MAGDENFHISDRSVRKRNSGMCRSERPAKIGKQNDGTIAGISSPNWREKIHQPFPATTKNEASTAPGEFFFDEILRTQRQKDDKSAQARTLKLRQIKPKKGFDEHVTSRKRHGDLKDETPALPEGTRHPSEAIATYLCTSSRRRNFEVGSDIRRSRGQGRRFSTNFFNAKQVIIFNVIGAATDILFCLIDPLIFLVFCANLFHNYYKQIQRVNFCVSEFNLYVSSCDLYLY